MEYEQAKELLEKMFLDPCKNCQGTGKVDRETGLPFPAAGSDRTWAPCRDCADGKVLNGLGAALIEFIGDHLAAQEKFAEKDHGHYISSH